MEPAFRGYRKNNASSAHGHSISHGEAWCSCSVTFASFSLFLRVNITNVTGTFIWTPRKVYIFYLASQCKIELAVEIIAPIYHWGDRVWTQFVSHPMNWALGLWHQPTHDEPTLSAFRHGSGLYKNTGIDFKRLTPPTNRMATTAHKKSTFSWEIPLKWSYDL
jgi:hypothetical protein